MARVKQVGLHAVLATILLTVPVCAATAASEGPGQSVLNSSEEKALRAQAVDYAKAYAAGDAAALANMWTPDGTYTDEEGLELKGRAEIQKYFAAGFKLFGAEPLQISIDSFRFPATDVSIEEGTCRVLKGSHAGFKTRYTVVHVKENGQWLVASATESPVIEQARSESLNDLSWLIGSWTAKGAKGTMHLKADWAGDHKFIHCSYSSGASASSDQKTGQVQIIGWSPRTKQITSWHFGSEGGYGSGRWAEDGQSFIEHTFGVEPDGSVSSSVNTLNKVSDNSFTWRSTGRFCDDVKLPDSPEITVTRDQ